MLTPPTSVDLRCRPAWVARFHCHCLEYHHDVDPENIDLLEYDSYSEGDNIIVDEGDAEDYEDLLHLLRTYNLEHDNE